MYPKNIGVTEELKKPVPPPNRIVYDHGASSLLFPLVFFIITIFLLLKG